MGPGRTLGLLGGALLGAALLASCGDDTLELAVDVRTDFAPALEFDVVHTELTPDGARSPLASGDLPAFADRRFVDGVRAAELGGLAPGDYTLETSLRTLSGVTIVTRRTELRLGSSHALTVVLARSCRDVRCPPASDPTRTTCSSGRCVAPRCSSDDPAACGTPACATDSDCTSGVTCALPRCAGAECLLDARDDRCRAGERCDAERGCLPLAGDAGVGPDAGRDAGAAMDAGAADAGPADAGPRDAGRDAGYVCGNARVEPGEACDDGVNNCLGSAHCAPGCAAVAFSVDNMVAPLFGGPICCAPGCDCPVCPTMGAPPSDACPGATTLCGREDLGCNACRLISTDCALVCPGPCSGYYGRDRIFRDWCR